MPPTTLSLIQVDTAEGVATIVIRRPEWLNSINPAVIHQLSQALESAIQDSAVQGIVLGGAGKAFVAGADLGFFLRNVEAGDLERIVKFTEAAQHVYNTIDHCPKPVVARLNGIALGGGAELALACDRIVASPRASLGFPETGLGIFPALGGTQRLPRAIGVGLAKWLIFTGKTLSAPDAVKIGLVERIVPDDQLETAARGMALDTRPHAKLASPAEPFKPIERFFASHSADALRTGAADTGGDPMLQHIMRQVANKGPVALRVAERLIEESVRLTLDEGLRRELDHVQEIYATQDAYIGLSSRLRRQIGQPAFAGR